MFFLRIDYIPQQVADYIQCSALIYCHLYAIIHIGGDYMKKVLLILSGILSLAYITIFCMNVSDLVSKHMEYEISCPLYVFYFQFCCFSLCL